jgi:Tfp pilus assembly protein PilN
MNEKGVRLAVFFVLGMIMGSVFVSIYIGRQIDHLTQENEILLRQQEQLQDELNHLKESMGEREKEKNNIKSGPV